MNEAGYPRQLWRGTGPGGVSRPAARFGVVFLAVMLAWLGAAPVAHAQQPQGNFRIGDLILDLRGSFEVEYNDNVNFSNNNKQTDIILRPGFTLSGFYQVSDINSISLELGVAYEQYIFHPNLSSYTNFATVSPDSQLAYTFLINQFTIKLYDSFDYSAQPSDAFAEDPNTGKIITNVQSYARFMNQVGVNVDWDLDRLVLYAGLYRADVFPQQEQFSFLRRWQYTASLGGRYSLSPTLTAGFGVNYTLDYYQEDLQSDSGSLFFGPTLQWKPVPNWTFTFTGGYVMYNFTNTGTNGDTSQPSTVTGELTVINKLTDTIDQTLTLTRASSFGYVSNTVDINRVAYQVSWKIEPKSLWTTKAWAYYEWGNDSGGTSPEDYSKFAVSPELDYDMSKKTSLYLSYQYTQKYSNFADRVYNQNQVIFGIKHEF
jgi:predicted porin